MPTPILPKDKETFDKHHAIGECIVNQPGSFWRRRIMEQAGQEVPESKPILEINVKHPLVTRLSSEADDERFGELSKIVLDHAMLAEGTPLENPADYVQRMNKLLLDIGAA